MLTFRSEDFWLSGQGRTTLSLTTTRSVHKHASTRDKPGGQKDRDRPYTKIRLALALAQVFDSGDAAHLMAFSIRRWKCGLDQALLS